MVTPLAACLSSTLSKNVALALRDGAINTLNTVIPAVTVGKFVVEKLSPMRSCATVTPPALVSVAVPAVTVAHPRVHSVGPAAPATFAAFVPVLTVVVMVAMFVFVPAGVTAVTALAATIPAAVVAAVAAAIVIVCAAVICACVVTETFFEALFSTGVMLALAVDETIDLIDSGVVLIRSLCLSFIDDPVNDVPDMIIVVVLIVLVVVVVNHFGQILFQMALFCALFVLIAVFVTAVIVVMTAAAAAVVSFSTIGRNAFCATTMAVVKVVVNAACTTTSKVITEPCYAATSVIPGVYTGHLLVIKYALLHQKCRFPLDFELW